MKSFPILKSFSLFFSALIFSPILSAQQTACYAFASPDNPESSPLGTLRTETWCYRKLSSPQGAVYAYNADGEEVKPELAFVIEPDGIMTHASLLAGEVTVHKVSAKHFNPFSVPSEEPQAVTAVLNSEIPELSQSAQSVLEFLLNEPAEFVEVDLREGDIESSAAEVLPWRGFWWPWKSMRLSTGSDSPLAKYDRFVKAKTGTNPGSQAWEKIYHKYRGEWWHGHCNGWAASAVLRKEPRKTVKDPVSGVSFSVSDQKGILAEADYCAKISFFGKRYRGNSGDDIKDIYPKDFHHVVTYYVGTLKKPVAIDYYRSTTVDNHVISGYKMTIKKTGPHTYQVRADLKVHKYDGFRTNVPAIAPTYTRTYRYTLEEDGDGQIIGGNWFSTNPDFLWVPLSPQDCNSNNAKMSHAIVEEILALPAL